MRMKKRKSKISTASSKLGQSKGVITEYLPWILIALAVLAVLMISAFLLKGKGINLLQKIKELFTGG